MSPTARTATFTLTRQPLELRLRRVQVHSVHQITPAYRRVVFEGPDLVGFSSLAADDHLRIFFPQPGQPLPQSPDQALESREFTPFEWDGHTQLTIDFVLHGEGVAAAWAQQAQLGDEVFIGGPRGSLVLTGEPAWWLLAGDLTALPAIRRHLAAVAPGTPVDVVLVSDDAADEQDLVSPGQLHLRWVHPEPGSRPGEVGVLLDALAQIPARAGDGFAFIAAEQSVVAPGRALLTARGVDLERAVVKGYWKRSPSTATSGQGLVIR